MKKTPLRRSSPLKRSTKCTLRKTRLKPMSKNKQGWVLLYKERPKMKGMESHHVFGRLGNRMLAYLFITPELHKWIHANGREARRLGWLQGPYDGRPLDPNAPRPWDSECESSWPDEYKRKPKPKIITKNGLLYRDGQVIQLPMADKVAQDNGFWCAERFVTHLENIQSTDT